MAEQRTIDPMTIGAIAEHIRNVIYGEPFEIVEQKLTKRQAAIIGAYTGVLCGPFKDLHEYVASLPGFEGIGSISFSMPGVAEAIKKAAENDFMGLCP